MDIKELLTPLLNTLDHLCSGFVLKDFVGFLNWEPTVGAALLAYTGHHSAFCTAVKQNSAAYARCVQCADIHQRFCERTYAPFCRPCFLGISEYSVPIIIDELCIGSISVGHYCSDYSFTASRISALSNRFGLEESTLLQCFAGTVGAAPPSEDCKIVIVFIARYLAEVFRPYTGRVQKYKESQNVTDIGFENIQKYIYRCYTDPGLNVTSIARACNYSHSYVSHTFNQRMKINLRTYINQLRIILAKHELRNGCSVSFTAMVCGFNDANYFCKVFQSMVGIPPSQYAKHVNKKEELNSLPPEHTQIAAAYQSHLP
ncbi:hypothetical protein C0033_23350 [Clostridium sp. chh4-2]|uniref:helix-turn-helix domain-containing protein n=1 Tax=Clostridium sp. chh4-2 TaxID=2067550 RepID=UPI000CCF1D93|nr:helix-turn-helix domain-containing protein [Clostridium sp. chh4-2]PNV59520.1 hypothetical protein C0033_23350 [Clostridium sp. chh4-2]